MANTTTSPDMNMPVPVVGTDPGPDWANNINACLSIIDQHTHTTGQGVPITPDAIDINTDLTMNENNLIDIRTTRFTSQSVPIPASGSDLGALYESGVDLYYNDGAGNQVRITQGGTVTGATGTITGLPSGTASASFSGNTFTFQSATNTPANMAVGPLIIGRNTVSPATVTLTPNSSQISDYSLVFPISLPSSTSFLSLDSLGNIAASTLITTGTVASTFTFDGTGSPGTSPSVTVRYQIVGNYVTLFIPQVLANTGINSKALGSNSNLPSALRPLTQNANARGPADILDNGISTLAVGLLIVAPTGQMFILKDNVQTSFTNSASGGSNLSFSATYYVGTGS